MPDIEITIGGRSFTVSCQPGEEHFLNAAAAMLDTEAQPLVAQMGRLPEARMLLMAGLMLADKTAAVEDENRRSSSNWPRSNPAQPPNVKRSKCRGAARLGRNPGRNRRPRRIPCCFRRRAPSHRRIEKRRPM